MSAFDTPYGPDDLLPLSGIQHYLFCRRQWALIHVEKQWSENRLTAEGRQMHGRADDPFLIENRDGAVVSRSVPVASYHLGLTGICDVVEFKPSNQGILLPGRDHFYQPAPVEYKRGKPKRNPSDKAQLCAQVICLEDMLSVNISAAYLFYNQTRRRVKVPMTDELRGLVIDIAAEMHRYYSRGYTPRVKKKAACRSCSLNDICLPELDDQPLAASDYIEKWLREN